MFMREFEKMRSHSRKIPAEAKKLIRKEGALGHIEKFFSHSKLDANRCLRT